MAEGLKLRMALLADVHLGTAATQFPNQDYTYAPDLLRRAISAIRALNPDELIVVGDLVNMGTTEEYAMAREILDDLRKPITVVPGNHELVKGNLDTFFNGAIGARIDDAS